MFVGREADSAVDFFARLDLQVKVLVVAFTCFYWRQIMKVETIACSKMEKRGILYRF